MKHLSYFAVALAFAAACSGHNDGPVTDPSQDTPGSSDAVKVEIMIDGGDMEYASEISYSMKVRDFAYILTKLTPEDSPAVLTYDTDDISIARVSRNGSITARGEGKTDIKVLADGVQKAVCHLTVTEYEATVSSFALNPSKVEIEWGSYQRIAVRDVLPLGISAGDVRFEFSSSDESVFTVENDQDGFGCKVYGVSPGEASLHADVKDARLDIPVVIGKKVLGLESWRFDSPYNDMEPAVFRAEKLTAFYPTFVDVYIFDTTSGARLDDANGGKYNIVNSNKETLNTAAWEDCISIAARGDGSSDDEGWGTVSLHYENDLVVSDIEDLEIEFRGFNGMHGDMTIVENNSNSDDYGKDLCGATQQVSSKGRVQVRLGRKSGEELMGVYRPNSDKEWVKLITEGLDVVRWDPKTLSLNATVSQGATSCVVLFQQQGQWGSIKTLVVNYTVI